MFVYLDAHLRPLNKSDYVFNLQRNDNEILIKSSTGSNITLNCELKTNINSNDVKIGWYYYKYENEKLTGKRVKVNFLNDVNIKFQTAVKTTDNYKLLNSKLTLNDLRSTQFGYYECAVENYQIKSSLNSFDLNLNSTYFLQVQCKLLFFFINYYFYLTLTIIFSRAGSQSKQKNFIRK